MILCALLSATYLWVLLCYWCTAEGEEGYTSSIDRDGQIIVIQD